MGGKQDKQSTGAIALWYRQPAARWHDALPVGNGRQGAMIWGGIEHERISLDESTCWAGEPSLENNRPDGPRVVRQIRREMFKGNLIEAYSMAKGITGRKLNYGTNLPLGNLRIDLSHPDGEIHGYRRDLDLDTAVASVSYRVGQVSFRREVFASNPDQVIVVRLSCDRPSCLSCRISLDGAENPFETQTDGDDTILLDGQAYEMIHSDGETGVSFHGRLQVMTRGGEISAQDGRILVDGADTVILVVGLGTTFDGNDPVQACRGQVETATARGYSSLLRDHVADHQRLFRRVVLDLGPSAHPELPTDERVKLVSRGRTDPHLSALLFQLGRYLLIDSSRENSPLPAHLTGVWNDNVACRIGWTCDYHLDINTQMIYWIAELTNLGECVDPLFRWIRERLVPSGRHTAKALYGCPGWVAHIVSNPWGFSAPGWSNYWGIFPTGGIWVASHLWDHYRFRGDRDFLETQAYPVLKEAAEFFLDYLVEHPQKGWLVTGPACSPENAFLYNGDRIALTMGPTVDRILIYELFSACIQASQILEVDADFRATLEQARSKLPPYQIGKHGQLQEWLEDYDEAIQRHRHTSHLLGLFPFDQVSPFDTPELARAARVSVERRLNAPGGFEDGAWARNNMTLFLARLEDGEAAHESLDSLFWNQSDGTMFVGTKLAPRNAYEMDYNTGATASIAEMLLQSQRDRITLLPALPSAWPTGYVKGLCGRGGFEVDIAWKDGRLTEATIRSKLGKVCRVRARTELGVRVDGKAVDAKKVGPRVIEFQTRPGATYELSPQA